MEKVLPANHPGLAWSYNSIGISLGSLGREKEALEIWEEVLPSKNLI